MLKDVAQMTKIMGNLLIDLIFIGVAFCTDGNLTNDTSFKPQNIYLFH